MCYDRPVSLPLSLRSVVVYPSVSRRCRHIVQSAKTCEMQPTRRGRCRPHFPMHRCCRVYMGGATFSQPLEAVFANPSAKGAGSQVKIKLLLRMDAVRVPALVRCWWAALMHAARTYGCIRGVQPRLPCAETLAAHESFYGSCNNMSSRILINPFLYTLIRHRFSFYM